MPRGSKGRSEETPTGDAGRSPTNLIDATSAEEYVAATARGITNGGAATVVALPVPPTPVAEDDIASSLLPPAVEEESTEQPDSTEAEEEEPDYESSAWSALDSVLLRRKQEAQPPAPQRLDMEAAVAKYAEAFGKTPEEIRPMMTMVTDLLGFGLTNFFNQEIVPLKNATATQRTEEALRALDAAYGDVDEYSEAMVKFLADNPDVVAGLTPERQMEYAYSRAKLQKKDTGTVKKAVERGRNDVLKELSGFRSAATTSGKTAGRGAKQGGALSAMQMKYADALGVDRGRYADLAQRLGKGGGR